MAGTEASRCLLVFAKAPVAGEVKTRLHGLLSPEQCARLHRRLVSHCMAVVSELEGVTVELWAGSEHDWLNALSRRYDGTSYLQRGKHLGERMHQAFVEALKHSDQVIIIGTDCPYLTADYLQDAFAALEHNDLVLGPAEDGGYVLIGLQQPQPALFESISWGSELVLAQTRHKASLSGLRFTELSIMRDIDRPADVKRLSRLLPALTAGIVEPSSS